MPFANEPVEVVYATVNKCPLTLPKWHYDDCLNYIIQLYWANSLLIPKLSTNFPMNTFICVANDCYCHQKNCCFKLWNYI